MFKKLFQNSSCPYQNVDLTSQYSTPTVPNLVSHTMHSRDSVVEIHDYALCVKLCFLGNFTQIPVPGFFIDTEDMLTREKKPTNPQARIFQRPRHRKYVDTRGKNPTIAVPSKSLSFNSKNCSTGPQEKHLPHSTPCESK